MSKMSNLSVTVVVTINAFRKKKYTELWYKSCKQFRCFFLTVTFPDTESGTASKLKLVLQTKTNKAETSLKLP